MINTKLLSMSNIAIIAAIAIATHVFAKPLYKIIDGQG